MHWDSFPLPADSVVIQVEVPLGLNSESDSCGILTLTNLPYEFLNHWKISSCMKNRATPKRNKTNYTKRINVS